MLDMENMTQYKNWMGSTVIHVTRLRILQLVILDIYG